MTAGSKTFFLFHVTPSFQVTPFDGSLLYNYRSLRVSMSQRCGEQDLILTILAMPHPPRKITWSQTTGSQLHILTIKGMKEYITVLQY